MQKNIIGTTVKDYKKKLNIHYTITACVVIIAIAVNVTLCLIYSESTHVAFLIINILVDVVAVWFTLFFTSIKIISERKLLSLISRVQFGEKFATEVKSISETTTRIGIFNCFEIITSDERRFYLFENGKIKLNAGSSYAFTLVDNIVVEAEDEQGD